RESSAHAFCKRPDPPCNQRAVAHAAETAELFNVEMDDLAWFLALVAWMWFLQLEASRLRPRRLRMRETLALEMSISAAMCCWVRRSRRKFRRRRLWQAVFGLAMKGVLRIDRASHPRLRHRSDRPICRRSSGSY